MQWSYEYDAVIGHTEITCSPLFVQSYGTELQRTHWRLQGSVVICSLHAGAAWPSMLWCCSYWSHPACLRWAIEHGAPWGSEPVPGTCCTLCGKLSPQLFEFAHRHGCPCDCEVYRQDCAVG